MTINFMHIPKTAGTNVRHYLYQNLGPTEVCFVYEPETLGFPEPTHQPICLPPRTARQMAAAAAQQFRVIYGHIAFTHFPACPGAVYATFLRHPRDHIRSWFGHVHRAGNIARPVLNALNNGQDYADIIMQHRVGAIDNSQTRLITGCNRAFGEVSEQDFKTACRYIDEYFSFVGITERFDESVEVMFERLDLPRAEMPSGLNRGSGMADASSLDMDACYAKWDRRLYDYALEKLDRDLQALG
jgi:hypothetical protein